MTELTREQRNNMAGLIAAKFMEAYKRSQQFADDLRFMDTDEATRAFVAEHRPEMSAIFEKLTSEEVNQNADIWPMASAVADAVLFAVETMLPVAAQIQEQQRLASTPPLKGADYVCIAVTYRARPCR